MNDKKITVEITDRQLAAILAADYCLRRSRQAQCKGLFIENIRDEKSRRITFTDAIEVLDELLADIVPRMDAEEEAETKDYKSLFEDSKRFNHALTNRLLHLLESSFIKSFDEKYATGEYKRDIAEADRLTQGVTENG